MIPDTKNLAKVVVEFKLTDFETIQLRRFINTSVEQPAPPVTDRTWKAIQKLAVLDKWPTRIDGRPNPRRK